MSRTSSKPDVAATPRASTLIADPANVSWPLALIFLVALMLDQSVGLGARWDEGLVSLRAAEIVSSSATTLLVLWLSKFIYLRTRFAQRHAWVMVTSMFTAVLLGSIVGRVVMTALAPSDAADLPPLSLDRTIFGTAVLVIAAWVLGSLRAFRASASELQTVQQQLTATRNAREQTLGAERDNVIAPISEVLRRLLEELRRLSPAVAAQRIQSTAEGLVRPISHELITTTTPVALPPPAPLPNPSWRQTLSQVAATPLMLPTVMAIVMTLLIGRLSSVESGTLPERPDVAVTVDLTSLIRALVQLAIVFVAVWLSAYAASRILRAILPRCTMSQQWAIVLGSVPAVAIAAQVLVLLAFSSPVISPETQEALRNPLLFIVPLAIIAAVAGLIRTAQTRLADILRDLQDRNAELAFEIARLNEELWMQRRSLSMTLHGPVQGTLNSASLLLATAPDANSSDMKSEAAQRIQRALEALESQAAESIDVVEELALIRGTWQGICDMEIDMADGTVELIEADPVCAASFIDIVGEATANAVIHGHAGRLAVSITRQSDREVRIEAVDDGSGITDRDGGGLGSQLLREACTEWGLTSDGQTTRLFAVVPVRRGR